MREQLQRSRDELAAAIASTRASEAREKASATAAAQELAATKAEVRQCVDVGLIYPHCIISESMDSMNGRWHFSCIVTLRFSVWCCKLSFDPYYRCDNGWERWPKKPPMLRGVSVL